MGPNVAYGSLCVYIDSKEFLCVHIGPYSSLRIRIGCYGSPLVLNRPYGL